MEKKDVLRALADARDHNCYVSDEKFEKICEEYGIGETAVMEKMLESKNLEFIRSAARWYISEFYTT